MYLLTMQMSSDLELDEDDGKELQEGSEAV